MREETTIITMELRLNDYDDLRLWRRIRIALERLNQIRGVEITFMRSSSQPDHLILAAMPEGEKLE